MDEKRPGYYAVIPAEVRYDRNLTPNARLLYAEITALLNDEGYCFASNAHFAELYEVKERTVSGWISELRKRGYITVFVDRDTDGKVTCRKIRVAVSAPDGQPVEEIFHTPGKSFREGVEENFQYTNLSNTNIKENKKEKPPAKPKRPPKKIIDPMPVFIDWIDDTFPDATAQQKNALYLALLRLVQSRAETNHPLQSIPAVSALCNRLLRYTNSNISEMIDLLDTAVDNGWRTVYPRKDSKAAPAAAASNVLEGKRCL